MEEVQDIFSLATSGAAGRKLVWHSAGKDFCMRRIAIIPMMSVSSVTSVRSTEL